KGRARVGVFLIEGDDATLASSRAGRRKPTDPAVVLNVQSEARKPDFSQKRFDDLGCLVEGVAECRRIRHVGVAKSRIVRGDDMKPVGERRYQIAILV